MEHWNSQLAHIRSVVEHFFGALASRFQFLLRPWLGDYQLCKIAVLVSVALQNRLAVRYGPVRDLSMSAAVEELRGAYDAQPFAYDLAALHALLDLE